MEEAPLDSAEAVSEAAAAAPGGVAIAPELARWVRSTQQHVRSRWITPPEFLDRGLVTMLEVTLTSTGALLGSPQVVRGSGDPFFDDNAVRAVMRAAPLPAPPEPGLWRFAFRSASR